MQSLTNLIEHHGYIILFLSLMLELIALPIPGEFLMGYAGVLVYQGKLSWLLSSVVAGLGSCTGMTISYLVGYKLGAPFFHKHGHRIHMGPDRLEKMSNWFEKYGNKLIVVAFYIPGVRHFTGYFSGITHISFRAYAIYAYLGAFIWTGTFIFLGKLLGPQWELFHDSLKKYFFVGSVIFIFLFVFIYILRKYKVKIKETIMAGLGKGVQRIHSLRRLRLLIAVIAVLFLIFVIFVISLTENYLNNEFKQFDTIVITLVTLIFDESWEPWMSSFGLFASIKVTIPLIVLTSLWILLKSKDRILEISFLLFVVIGGEFFEEGIRRIYYHLQPVHPRLTKQILYSFPSEQSITAFFLFGFFAYLFVRYSKNAWMQTFASILIFIIIILIGLSRIYLMQQLPSDVVAGYAFGGVWLSLNILVMEIFRFTNRLNRLKYIK
ncbi:VTT domain-containing protein [Bacillus sp. FJAT-49705]|uniref:VTT domain-containing protein n=1 Tax=Cytobacillus citreus TaxID=2833586 RepID=A0ABS5NNT7_9BACI|nr:VTT domain-containing protein [Cytobacillus citreus]MBS4189490.1 VTT domain-containing protein [Cytobacillus citreus]